ncbi:hypothetical protein C5167_000936 [Papaver somniferum]|uniref:Uncharacterized protein n=1 Tax=Papaver somniferum TaxID=3469 RepID=A0A4Y7KXF7_PAPSO|nr:hypothetical protein C5167_000936 [Papaver somniferum]
MAPPVRCLIILWVAGEDKVITGLPQGSLKGLLPPLDAKDHSISPRMSLTSTVLRSTHLIDLVRFVYCRRIMYKPVSLDVHLSHELDYILFGDEEYLFLFQEAYGLRYMMSGVD